MADVLEQPHEGEQQGLPQPDPALRQLDRFVGTWRLEGHLVGSDENTIKGEASYRWLPGGFFLEQRIKLDFMQYQIESVEFIGYDPETKSLPSTVFSSMSPVPLPYRREVDGDRLGISVDFPPLDATFEGEWTEDGRASRAAGDPTRGRTRPSTSPTTSAAIG
jgi:hypothetical protein